MRRRRWSLWLIAAIMAAVVTVVWVVPVVAGPDVECGPLDPVTCEEMWPVFVARTREGQLEWLPVTRVVIGASSPDECGSWLVERWIFASVVHNDC